MFCVALFGLSAYAANDAHSHDTQLDPLRIELQYRPGAYFPEGFKLYSQVKLLTAPVRVHAFADRFPCSCAREDIGTRETHS